MIFSTMMGASAQDKPFSQTALHRAIASESDWLNTSRPIVADDLTGRIILLDFWTFCCINCIHVIPDLQYLEHKFGDQLTVIGVHSAKFQNERDRDNIRQAILRYGIEHAVVNDAAFKIWQQFAVRAWPTLILINPEGKIEEVYSGEGNRAEIESDVSRLIERYGARVQSASLPLDLEKNKRPPTILNFPGKIAHAPGFKNAELFISDSSHNRIITADKNGQIVQIIGDGQQGDRDGDLKSARFNKPQGILPDLDKNILYIADTGNHKLRQIDFNSGKVTTIAGTGERGGYRFTPGSNALDTALASPWDLAFFPTRAEIVIANAGSHQLFVYDTGKKTLRIFAGNGRESIDDGVYPSNSLSQPSGLSVSGDKLYFVDSETSSLRVADSKGDIKTLIGTGLFDFGLKDGKQGQALLQHALGLHAEGGVVWIADSYNHAIRKYDVATGHVTTIFGDGKSGADTGAFASAKLNEPNAIIPFTSGTYLVADTNNSRLVQIDMAKKQTKPFELMFAPNMAEYAKPETLPNLHVTKAIEAAANKKIAVQLDLLPGWKLNAEAPSALALFITAKDGQKKIIQSWDLPKLKSGKFNLPELQDGGKYELQGTLYYCEDKEGSICLIRSFNQQIESSKTYSGSAVKLDLR